MGEHRSIWLANPRGFCAGVERAIDIVDLLLDRHGAPVYVKHEVVHNTFVINKLEEKGAIFIEDIATVPTGAILVYSAHGVSKAVRHQAEGQDLKVHDATCPLVSKVHARVIRLHKSGHQILMIGHNGHPEVEGTMGQVANNIYLIETVQDVKNLKLATSEKIAYVTQTTLSVDETIEIITAIHEKFPVVIDPPNDDICYATQNRQDAVKNLAKDNDLVLVVGSATSSNSNRLREVAEGCGTVSKLVDGPDDIDPKWLDGCKNIAVTAGASAPEEVVKNVIEKLRTLLVDVKISELDGVSETVSFSVPKDLERSKGNIKISS